MLYLGWRVVIFIGQLTRPYTCCANVYASLTGRRQLKRTRRTTDLVHTRACHRRPTTKPTAFVFLQTSIYLPIAVSLFFPRGSRFPRSNQPAREFPFASIGSLQHHEKYRKSCRGVSHCFVQFDSSRLCSTRRSHRDDLASSESFLVLPKLVNLLNSYGYVSATRR